MLDSWFIVELLQKSYLSAARNDRDLVVRIHLIVDEMQQSFARAREAGGAGMQIVKEEKEHPTMIIRGEFELVPFLFSWLGAAGHRQLRSFRLAAGSHFFKK